MGCCECVEIGEYAGDLDIRALPHTYKERSATGESTTKQVTFCITANCLHARPCGEPTEDLEWAVKWSHAEDR